MILEFHYHIRICVLGVYVVIGILEIYNAIDHAQNVTQKSPDSA